MCNDSDEEISDLDIESKTWNKLEKNMKLLGFREGAVQGRELSLQTGFDLGYQDGIKLGEHLGIVRGILSCQKELGVTLDMPDKNIPIDKICILCTDDQHHKAPMSEEIYSKDFEESVSLQRNHTNKIINSLEKSPFNAYFEKR